MCNESYSVYINNNRINEEYLTQEAAEELAMKYTDAGFKDVLVVDENSVESI